MKHAVIALLPLALAAAGEVEARADQILLKDGQLIEGRVMERGETLEIALDFGSISFPKSEIQEIRRAPTALEEFERKKSSVSQDNVEASRQLAVWAREHGLERHARDLYRRILEVAPNDAKAHEALGDRLLDSKWVDEEAYLRARGLVRYGGGWKTEAEVRTLEAEAAARKRAQEERERARSAERQAKAEEEKAEAAQQEQRVLERLAFGGPGSARSGWDPYGYGYGYGYGDSYGYRYGYDGTYGYGLGAYRYGRWWPAGGRHPFYPWLRHRWPGFQPGFGPRHALSGMAPPSAPYRPSAPRIAPAQPSTAPRSAYPSSAPRPFSAPIR